MPWPSASWSCNGDDEAVRPALAARPDVVPARLPELATRWPEAGSAKSFVCMLKFQGDADHATARAFAAIPGSRLVPLAHNKHKLAWVLVRWGPRAPGPRVSEEGLSPA